MAKVKKSFYIPEHLAEFLIQQAEDQKEKLGFKPKPSQILTGILVRLKSHQDETNEDPITLLDRCCKKASTGVEK